MCADWEKAPVELSIVEKKVLLLAPKKRVYTLFFIFYIDVV